jgi:hypothetical protein
MKTTIATLLLLAAFGAHASSWQIHSEGYGPVRIGMTLGQAERLLGSTLVLKESPLVGGCFVATPKKGHKGVQLIVQGNSIAFAVATAVGTRADSGLQVGDKAAEVRRRYGDRVEVVADRYVDNSRHLFIWEKNKSRGLRFEIGSDDRINGIRGGNPTIVAEEGPCS